MYESFQSNSFRKSSRSLVSRFHKERSYKTNVVGWVKNMPDGTVYLEAEGEEEQLKQLEKWLHVGSPMSRVNRIEVEWTEPTDEYSTFEMKF